MGRYEAVALICHNTSGWKAYALLGSVYLNLSIIRHPVNRASSLSPGVMPAGDYSSQSQAIHWDGRNQTGEPVSSGVYLYTINAGDFTATRKMLIRK